MSRIVIVVIWRRSDVHLNTRLSVCDISNVVSRARKLTGLLWAVQVCQGRLACRLIKGKMNQGKQDPTGLKETVPLAHTQPETKFTIPSYCVSLDAVNPFIKLL
jgi:hypothetical protein